MISEKRDELIRRFGNKFFNELGQRVIEAQQLQGRKKGEINSNAMALANQITEQLWKEWVEQCEHDQDKANGFCSKCKSYIIP